MLFLSRVLSIVSLGAAVMWVLALFHGFSPDWQFCFNTAQEGGCGTSVTWSGRTLLWLAPIVFVGSLWLRGTLVRANVSRQRGSQQPPVQR